MTNDSMDLQALLGKSPDADFLREMIGFAAQRRLGELDGATGGAAQRLAAHQLAPTRPQMAAVSAGRRVTHTPTA